MGVGTVRTTAGPPPLLRKPTTAAMLYNVVYNGFFRTAPGVNAPQVGSIRVLAVNGEAQSVPTAVPLTFATSGISASGLPVGVLSLEIVDAGETAFAQLCVLNDDDLACEVTATQSPELILCLYALQVALECQECGCSAAVDAYRVLRDGLGQREVDCGC